MGNIPAIVCLLLISITCHTFGQTVSETNFSLGISNTSSSEFKRHYEQALPSYLIISGSKSWYSNNHWISLRKEAGLNLQYAPIDLSSGGLGASSDYMGNITSLLANASLQVRIRINGSMAFGAGPEAEVLLVGKSSLINSYYYGYCKPPVSGDRDLGGLNRDYFNQPSYGIKVSLFESNSDSKISIGLNFSYLWTQREFSNFYADNYTRFSILIGFKKQKKDTIAEPMS